MAKAKLIGLLPALIFSLTCSPATYGQRSIDDVGPFPSTTTSSGNAVPGTDRGGTTVTTPPAPPPKGLPPQALPTVEKIRKSRTIAMQLAQNEWLDRIAAAYPPIIEAICEHPGPAAAVAAHPRIAQIADVDHYLCRRLTRWHHATEVLLRNPHADRVIELDPQGIYWAIERRPAYGRLLAGHSEITSVIEYDPNVARVMVDHMR